MFRRIFIISKFTWVNILRRLGYWPHVFIFIFFSFQVYQTGFKLVPAIDSFSVMISLTLSLMLFLGLNEGREELSRKTIIRLRTLPINWAEECLGSTLAIATYCVSMMSSIMIFLLVLHMNDSSSEIIRYIEIEDGMTHKENQIILSSRNELQPNENFVVEIVFREEGLISDISAAIVPLTDQKESIFLKSKRKNELKSNTQEFTLPSKFLYRNRSLDLVVEKLYIVEKGLSLYQMYFNSGITFFIQGALATFLFVLLGRKVSIEVGVFFILGCLLINLAYSLLGEELIKGNLEKLSRFENGGSRFKSHWWEPYLFKITLMLSYVEHFKGLFQFQSVVDHLRRFEMIEFPLFNVKFLKEIISFSFVLCLSSFLLRPKET